MKSEQRRGEIKFIENIFWIGLAIGMGLRLWLATNHLMLYGDADDEEEQKAVENVNKLLSGLPVSFSLGFLGLAMLIFGGFSPLMAPQAILSTLDGFILLAVPLFLLISIIFNNSSTYSSALRKSIKSTKENEKIQQQKEIFDFPRKSTTDLQRLCLNLNPVIATVIISQ